MLKQLTAAVSAVMITLSAAAAIHAEDIHSLDSAMHGYGQGRELDAQNRPLGALRFNGDYSVYDAHAILESENEIYFTFDQGYENGYTAPILDTLKEKNVKAIFFLTGDYAKRNKELVQRMIDEGHIIGNHGMTHASLPKLSLQDAEKDIMDLHELIKQEYNYEMSYFRPSCGEYSERILALCQNLGYKTLFWSFAYQDWDVNKQPDAKTASDRMSEAAHGGGIYLLHSVSSTNAAVLGDVIDNIRSQGYVFSLPKV